MKTASEAALEAFLTENRLAFQKVQEGGERKPDYLVEMKGLKLLFEVKELAEDDNFQVQKGVFQASSRTIGDHIRRKIAKARKQVQFGANQGIPSILLIYNNIDPEHLFATEDHDFITAMYGEYTVVLDRESPQIVNSYYGENNWLREGKNTSFSALGRLRPIEGKWMITFFENAFAKVKLPYDALPPCFEVKRFQISRA
jgi:hypothetical protein